MESTSAGSFEPPPPSFFGRHEFLIRRLHSLSGLIPIGAYMVVHLLTNATILGGPAAFQANVDRIHALGPLLPFVEWTFIFLPLLFHGIVGVVITRGGTPNTSSYPLVGNVRYTLQRATGIIAFVYIAFHVWQLNYLGGHFGGGQFDTEHAASSTAVALAPLWVKLFYLVGVTACVFHLANGIATMGITWGVWTSRPAQLRANAICAVFGVAVLAIGLSALVGVSAVDIERARVVEDRMERGKKILTGELSVDADPLLKTPAKAE